MKYSRQNDIPNYGNRAVGRNYEFTVKLELSLTLDYGYIIIIIIKIMLLKMIQDQQKRCSFSNDSKTTERKQFFTNKHSQYQEAFELSDPDP